ncbi:MAG TPA: CbtB-domain containing protein [Steroidobacteraceae bacterium]|nr:CbtB-domain containing protein [Steroidobacteraceae bacterium]
MRAGLQEKSLTLPLVIPIQKILPWAILGGMIFSIAMYFVGAEGGAFSSLGGMTVHEWVHDARHLLGFPCH